MRNEMLQRKRSRMNPTSFHWPSEVGGFSAFSCGFGCQLTGSGLFGGVLIGASSKDGVESCSEFQQCLRKEGDLGNQRQVRNGGFEQGDQFASRAAAGSAVVHAKIEQGEMTDVEELGQRCGCC